MSISFYGKNPDLITEPDDGGSWKSETVQEECSLPCQPPYKTDTLETNEKEQMAFKGKYSLSLCFPSLDQ